jgi:RNase P subunit RPR2
MIKQFLLKLFGYQQCEECHSWFRGLQLIFRSVNGEFDYTLYVCNQCKQKMGE